MANQFKNLFSTILMLSWLLFSFSLKTGLFHKFRNFQSESFEDSPDNDELGGSLLDVVAPVPGEKSDLFDSPTPKPETNLETNTNLEKVVAKVNTPVQKPTSEKKTDKVPLIKNISKTNSTINNSTSKIIPNLENNSTSITGNKNSTPTLQNNNSLTITNNNPTPAVQNITIPSKESNITSHVTNPAPVVPVANINKTITEPNISNNKTISNVDLTKLKKNLTAHFLKNSSNLTASQLGVFDLALGATPVKIKTGQTAARTTTNSNGESVVIISNETCHLNLTRNLHAPFPVPETANMRYYSLIAFITFGSIFLSLRYILSLFKGGDGNFFTKGVRILSSQTLLFFICVSIVVILYTFGVFDNYPFNWEYLIASLAIFGVGWVLFGILILSFCLMVTHKWKTLEYSCKDSFKSIKSKYELIANNNYALDADKKLDPSGVFELYEYLTLKIYFCLPFYPSFKACNMRREFKFNVYLNYCLLQKLRLFFKVSWTSWVITIFLVFVWSVFIVPQNALFITIFIMCFPILGLIVGVILYFYMRSIYRLVVQEINKDNYMSYLDVEHFNQHYATGQFINFPVYIDTLMKIQDETKVSGHNLHEHFHSRPPSLYEDQLAFGATGFTILINALQAIGFVFIIWSVVLFTKHFYLISSTYGYACLAFMIPGLLIYLVLYGYLLSISLRWYTIISSIEMKRNEECVRKAINYHSKKSAELSNTIFMSFKRLYFDMKISLKNRAKEIDDKHKQEEFNSLGRLIFQRMIDSYVFRFKKIPNKKDEAELLNPKTIDDYPINMTTELRAFLKSCGNKLDEKEIEFMLHMIEKFDSEERYITRTQLYDICGAIIHFGTIPPEEVVNDVFDQYFDSRKDIPSINRRDSKEMTIEILDGFMDYYNEYFSQEERTFIEQEIHYLGEKFSRDAFTYTILAPRRYHPN